MQVCKFVKWDPEETLGCSCGLFGCWGGGGGGVVFLTPSLPWCHLKTTNKRAKFETFEPFCLLFTWHVKGFSSKCSALEADVL